MLRKGAGQMQFVTVEFWSLVWQKRLAKHNTEGLGELREAREPAGFAIWPKNAENGRAQEEDDRRRPNHLHERKRHTRNSRETC